MIITDKDSKDIAYDNMIHPRPKPEPICEWERYLTERLSACAKHKGICEYIKITGYSTTRYCTKRRSLREAEQAFKDEQKALEKDGFWGDSGGRV